MILAIDTTSEFGSLALVEDGRVVDEALLHSPDGFAHILYDHIARLLARRELQVSDIDAFAAAAGPGSFTGVRVGLAAVKGLAEATRKPALGISNLRALAWFGELPLRATLLDARRGDVYGAVYNSSLNLAADEVVMKFQAWLDGLPGGDVEFLSTEMARFEAAFAGTRFADAPRRSVPRALAGAIGAIAFERWKQGAPSDPALLDANYVRRSDAELFWKDA